VNTPSPALVTQRGARRLPRLALLLLCAAYVLPGLLGRDPWRNADLVSFAQMAGIAQGRTSWWAPSLGALPVSDLALLPHWLGAAFISLLSPMVDADVAARLPFALLLVATLCLTWYATFHLARTGHAQPLAFAFGGEAEPVDYARAIADGALLATVATLGLLLLGHETTPELMQLACVSLLLYALAAAPYRTWQPRIAVLAALPILAGSGAPSMAVAMGLGSVLVCSRSSYVEVRALVPWLMAAMLAAVALASSVAAWHWRGQAMDLTLLVGIARQWVWFLWPSWPLVVWTLWRWRQHLAHRHIAAPLSLVLVALGSNLLMAGSDRALLLAVPGMAVLAAFALPTFKRSTAAAIDWFSMFFFTLAALFVWVIYIAMQTGVPAKPAANMARLLPGFVSTFSPLALVLAVLGTAAWVALVRWRTGRHREALWKSLVLPAGGVALCWLLTMTLWLAPLDYARSSRPWLERVAQHVPTGSCVLAPGASRVVLAALEHNGAYRVDARPEAMADGRCTYLLHVTRQERADTPPSWQLLAEVQRPTDRAEVTRIYRRSTP
jgi:4-amino-4-deoxy-L-arabinose transferase-like glycosyltransferase